jgi:phosphopantothenoylcysteine decarboxylase/phosphopantothenate--cysteine ligase
MMDGKRILLIVSGGIAAYKCPDLVRRLRERGLLVRCLLTQGGAEFVTTLALQAVSEEKVYQNLFSLTDENEMGHIRLSRESDLILVAPATANIIAKMAHGQADDLATTTLLANDKPVFIAPAMNHYMYNHPATQANLALLIARGVTVIGPDQGNMACREFGMGRMSEPLEIVDKLDSFFSTNLPLKGKRALVTSGPTFEAIDPVRFIGNRSSGKQGHAIARALAALGCQTTLISGPTQQTDPMGVCVVHVESAREMLSACETALPADIAVCAAAVSDWRVESEVGSKIKKTASKAPPDFKLTENPDILATLSQLINKRPKLVIGFAAETDDVISNATSKRQRKECDWIIANDVSPNTEIFNGDANQVHLITSGGVENWPKMSKIEVGKKLAERIMAHFEDAS